MYQIIQKIWYQTTKLLHFIFFKILHIKLTKEQWNNFLQFVKFSLIGLSNTLVSYITYIGSLLLFNHFNFVPNVDYLIAQVIAFILSVLWSFYWNSQFVFDVDKTNPHALFSALIKTYISYAFTGLFLNSILSLIFVEFLHISKLLAPLFNLLISVPINFILNKLWAFRKK